MKNFVEYEEIMSRLNGFNNDAICIDDINPNDLFNELSELGVTHVLFRYSFPKLGKKYVSLLQLTKNNLANKFKYFTSEECVKEILQLYENPTPLDRNEYVKLKNHYDTLEPINFPKPLKAFENYPLTFETVYKEPVALQKQLNVLKFMVSRGLCDWNKDHLNLASGLCHVGLSQFEDFETVDQIIELLINAYKNNELSISVD